MAVVVPLTLFHLYIFGENVFSLSTLSEKRTVDTRTIVMNEADVTSTYLSLIGCSDRELGRFVPLRVRRSRGAMYSGHGRLCVCLCVSLAVFPHYCTDPDVTWWNGRVPSTPWVKKGCHPNHGHNFVNSWSICKILSLLHYLGKLKNQTFAILMHVKHVSNVPFCHLSHR